MEAMKFDEFGDPIFRVIDIPLPGPDRIPPDLPDGYIPKYRHLIRQYELLHDLWNVQLGDKIRRTPWNLKAASAFWRDNLPDTFEGRRFGYTENWIEDAMRKTAAQIRRLKRVARRARFLKRVHGYLEECWQREEQERKENFDDEERGRSSENSKSSPADDSYFDDNGSERREKSPVKSPSQRIPLRPAKNLAVDKDLTNSREASPVKTPSPTELVDEEDAVTEVDGPISCPVLPSKI